jgi:hypothetical protein
VDRAYRLTCFYMETSKLVTSDLRVSMLPTTELANSRPMPTCRYEVLYGSLSGPQVRFAKVGDKVFHKWTCETGAHGMLVHSCVARDGAGAAYELVDQLGCAVDPIALGALTYAHPLSMAFTQVHVFKFADQMVVNFQCQITLCLVQDGGCDGLSPPRCPGVSAPHPQHPAPSYQDPTRPPGGAPRYPPLGPDYAAAGPRSQPRPSVYPPTVQAIGLDGRPLIPSPFEVEPPPLPNSRGPLPPPFPAPVFPELPRFPGRGPQRPGPLDFAPSHASGPVPREEMLYPPDDFSGPFPQPRPGPRSPQPSEQICWLLSFLPCLSQLTAGHSYLLA